MLKYLVIVLDNTSVSYCHYGNDQESPKLIAIENLASGILWAMKENLMVQFVYPKYELPQEYLELIDSIDHVDIKENSLDADVTIVNGIGRLSECFNKSSQIVLRLSLYELINNIETIAQYDNLNIVLTDIDKADESLLEAYRIALSSLSALLVKRIKSGKIASINIVTDRLQLSGMNNCNAGYESITLAPDGNFYVCPGFYYDGNESIGCPQSELEIKNSNLYKLDNAPICRICDAFHCKRCIWLNHKLTHEVNTPSREQCLISHYERSASRQLQESLKELGILNLGETIPKIDYNDPFEKLIK